MDRRSFLKMLAAVPLAGAAKAAVGADAPARFLRIAHLCDPQFGFITGKTGMAHRAKKHYKKNYKADIARCERALAAIDEIKPDLLLLGGDMTQWSRDLEVEWPRLLNGVKTPWMVTPGNHDMGNSVTRENLDRFRKVFGRDREARDVKGWRVIAGNSQFWHPTELKDEQAAYEEWLARELETAKSSGGHVVLATHISPFAFMPDEKDSYDNCPTSLRTKRLEAYAASGVRFMLTAHQHRLVVRGYKDMTILTGEATCDNFDFRPQGFRLFEVRDNFSYSYEFMGVS